MTTTLPRRTGPYVPPKVNEPLVQRVLAQIEATPYLWRQESWSTQTDCGTAHCFAGWAYVLGTGQEWRHDVDTLYNVVRIDRAVELLGFTPSTADEIFFMFTGDCDGPPTFENLCDLVKAQTGITYQRPEGHPCARSFEI